MDPRSKIAGSLLSTLQDLCNQAQGPGEKTPPMPAEIFDRYIGLLKLTLQWLGFVGTDEEFDVIAEKAGLGEYLRSLEAARAAKEAGQSASYGNVAKLA